MRLNLFVAAMMLALIATPAAQAENSMTMNGVKFDFDTMTPPTPAQAAFITRYREAIATKNAAKLRALFDASAGQCAGDQDYFIAKELKLVFSDKTIFGFLPPPKDMNQVLGMNNLVYFPVPATALLGINNASGYILRAVVQKGDTVAFVPNCLTEKGQKLMQQHQAKEKKS